MVVLSWDSSNWVVFFLEKLGFYTAELSKWIKSLWFFRFLRREVSLVLS